MKCILKDINFLFSRDLLQVIGTDKSNKGSYGFDVAPNRAKNQTMARIYKVGAIRISMWDSILDPTKHNIIPKSVLFIKFRC